MREGAELVTSARVKKVNINYIVKHLEWCSVKNGFCDNCPDLKVCVDAYDDRCALGETICKECGESVPITKLCSVCGTRLNKSRKINGGENERDSLS